MVFQLQVKKKTLETMGQKSEKNALDIKKTDIFGLKSKTLSVVPKTNTFFLVAPLNGAWIWFQNMKDAAGNDTICWGKIWQI